MLHAVVFLANAFALEVNLRIQVYLVTYDSGMVSLEHLLLSWYPSQPQTLGLRVEGLGFRKRDLLSMLHAVVYLANAFALEVASCLGSMSLAAQG